MTIKHFGRVLLVIVLVGLAVRVGYVAFAKDGACPTGVANPSARYACGDQIFYNAEANRLAAGDGFVEPLWSSTHPGESAPPAADHPPLTVLVLAPVSWLTDHPPLSWVIDDTNHVREHRYALAVLGAVLVFLVGLLGRRVGGDLVGLVAAGIAALSPNIWVNDGNIMSETVTGLVVVGALLLAFALWDRPSLWRAAALGVVCGLAALARAELVLVVVLLVVVVACTARGTRADRSAWAVAGVVAFTAVVGPWVGYNLARFHDRTYLSTNDGIALLGSNCDAVYYGSAIGLTSVAGPRDCLEHPPPPGDQSQVSSAYRRKAIDYMKAHKARVPLVVAARIARTWGFWRPFDMVRFNIGEGREPWVTRLGIFVYYPTLLAAIWGGIVLGQRRKWRELYLLLVPAVTVTIGVAVTYGQTRFRAAAEPSLAVLAAVGVGALVTRLMRRRGTATPRTDPTVAAVS